MSKSNFYTKKEISLKNGIWMDDYNRPVSGVKKSFYGNGVVQDETTLVNGLNDGVQYVYDPMGNLWYENQWKMGQLVSYKKIR